MIDTIQRNLNEFYSLAYSEYEKRYAFKMAVELGYSWASDSPGNECLFFKSRDDLLKFVEKPTFIVSFPSALSGGLRCVSIEIC